MVCKKQEQCKLGKMCGWAKDEETLLTECVEFIERVPLTNEEWFDGLSTEKKAKWMAKHMSFCEVCEIQTCRVDGCQRFDRGSMTETDAFREWLKEIHKE